MNGPGPTVPVSFEVHPRVWERLVSGGHALNLRPALYARQLFEAAYAVRCGHQKGETSPDEELDRQVRQAFLLADCEPEFIAAALGASEERVARIIEGWRRHLAGEARPRPAAPEPADMPEEGRYRLVERTVTHMTMVPEQGAARPLQFQRWSKAERARLAELWATGMKTPEIAKALGRAPGAVQQFASQNRDLCPSRSPGSGRRKA